MSGSSTSSRTSPTNGSWNPDCSSVEMLSPEPVGKGSTYRGHFRGMGQVTVELTAHDRPRHFATRERSRMATGDFEFDLTPYGEQTQVELRMQLRPHGAMRLLQPLMRRKIGQFLADLPGHIQGGLTRLTRVSGLHEVEDAESPRRCGSIGLVRVPELLQQR